uniref:E3 ubiquitin-protein ligase RNF213-like n=1 Tax=Styela clava TaxID=7725 RepID=UPI00193A33DD|nr:E3 ubiquitin-protein ligase RNF213-like [Styela clava]
MEKTKIERNEKITLKFAIEKIKDLKNKVLENVEHMFEGDIHLGDLDCWIHGPGKHMFKYGAPNVLPGIKDFLEYCRTAGLKAETLKKFSSKVVNVFAQIEVYEELSRCVPAACLIMKMKDCFGIAEESLYLHVKYISEKIYSKNIMLKDIKKNVFFVAPMLSDLLISDMVELFENFLKHNDFRYWIQSTMRDAKEINVMCELVANSYSKVTDSPKYSKDHNNFTIIMRDFTNAVNGFAPLLFDIQNKRIPFEELIKRCQIVGRNFKANPEIGQQWENSARKLTFFKEVEFQNISVRHESVYVKAKEIAENGIFSISVLPDNQASFMADISVTVPPSDTHQERKVILHDDLQDIQALISLMTEGSDQANDTSQIFSARLKVSERFAKVLVELSQARCTLFDTCIVNIYPVQDKRFTIEMKFEGSDPMEENQCELSDVESLASLLEETLKKWQRHVDNQRKQHYFLNEFNIEQMSYLSKELAIYNKNNEDGPLPHQVCALLSIVRRDTINDMRNLLKEAIDSINGTSRVGEDSNQDGSTGDHAEKVKLVETLRKEARCSREVAKAAIQKEGVDKIKCRRWIMKSKKKAKLIQQLSEKFDEDIAFISPSERKEAKQQTNRSNIILSIKKKCQNFMENGHGLGLGQLGRLLQLLRDQTNLRLLNRTLTLPLKRGTPNLICHNQKMYETILSLYMEGSDQSLPTSSEVLICSETTSTKTVERFLHRVMKKCENKGTPLFVLAAIDCLGNSVMKDVERIYHNLKEDELKDPDYQLVILCQNIKSYLALCFEPNTVEGLRIKKDNKIAEYLQSCLIADGRYEKSAAAIDDKRSLVRVVTSSSSGAGKSLYITRLKNKLKKRDTQPRFTTVRFLEKVLTSQQATRKLISENSPVTHEHLVHLDISTAVKSGIEEFLFNLLILGSIEGNDGKIWQRHSNHYYVIEVTDDNLVKKHSDVSLLNLLPRITTLQPHEIFNHTSNEENAIGMDTMKFESAEFSKALPVFQAPTIKLE